MANSMATSTLRKYLHRLNEHKQNRKDTLSKPKTCDFALNNNNAIELFEVILFKVGFNSCKIIQFYNLGIYMEIATWPFLQKRLYI